jgi:hypothetical protein
MTLKAITENSRGTVSWEVEMPTNTYDKDVADWNAGGVWK